MVIGCGEVKDTVERLKLRENLLTFENSKLIANLLQKLIVGENPVNWLANAGLVEHV